MVLDGVPGATLAIPFVFLQAIFSHLQKPMVLEGLAGAIHVFPMVILKIVVRRRLKKG